MVLDQAAQQGGRGWKGHRSTLEEVRCAIPGSFVDIAKDYGAKDCQPNEEIAGRWKEEFKALLKASKACEVVLREKLEFQSPLDPDMWAAWQRASSDLERHVAEWARHGALLGMACSIPPSEGIFRKVDDVGELEEAPALELQAKLKNYTSVYEDLEGAGEELGRYWDELRQLSRDLTNLRFGSGTVSRLALITQVKDEGVIKRRIVIDLLRLRSRERGCDRRAWKLRSERIQETDALDVLDPDDGGDDDFVELVGADLADAYSSASVPEWMIRLFGLAKKSVERGMGPARRAQELKLSHIATPTWVVALRKSEVPCARLRLGHR